MGRKLLLFALVLCAAPCSFGQGSVGVFATSDGALCNFYDMLPGQLMVHVVHVGASCATGCDFKVIEGGGFAGSYFREVNHVTQAVGTARTGMTVEYGMQRASPILIVTIVYNVSGSSAACSWIRVVEHPTVGGLYTHDCSEPPQYIAIPGGSAAVNPDQSCSCNVGVEATTWGGIKALYD